MIKTPSLYVALAAAAYFVTACGDPPEPVEYTWQAFLQIIFIPKMKKVVKSVMKTMI